MPSKEQIKEIGIVLTTCNDWNNWDEVYNIKELLQFFLMDVRNNILIMEKVDFDTL